MHQNLMEEEMRQALFGSAEKTASATQNHQAPAKAKSKMSKSYTPGLTVVLHVGNDFEGQRFEFIYQADTLSSLLAQQNALKVARKKYRYAEVVSVAPM